MTLAFLCVAVAMFVGGAVAASRYTTLPSLGVSSLDLGRLQTASGPLFFGALGSAHQSDRGRKQLSGSRLFGGPAR